MTARRSPVRAIDTLRHQYAHAVAKLTRLAEKYRSAFASSPAGRVVTEGKQVAA